MNALSTNARIEKVVSSLAILKVNWDQGRDYIENFVPFVAECFRNARQDEISLPELSDCIRETFGLVIPQGALKTILHRTVRRGYASVQYGVYRRNPEALRNSSFSQLREAALAKHEALIQRLIGFCQERYQIAWTVGEAESALMSYVQTHSAPILTAIVDRSSVAPPPSRNQSFLVNAFISDLYERDAKSFGVLETIVKGSMLADVVWFRDMSLVTKKFNGVEVLFDTGFLLRALGLYGEPASKACRELMDLLYEQNAQLRCFEHTVEELRHVLDGAAHTLVDPRNLRGPQSGIVEYFLRAGYRSSDVELVIARLEQSLQGLRLRVIARPSYKLPLGLDEDRLRTILQDEIHYRVPASLEHDVDAITSIYRLRNGKFPADLESSRAVFVTTNSSLARASNRFFKEQYGDSALSAPTCIADHLLTTLVWLKDPMKAPDLPAKRIIADCYAALSPPEELWVPYLEEMNRLRSRGDISTNDYHLLLLSMEARRALLDLTLGDPDAFCEGTVEEVLGIARASVRAEAEAALEAEAGRRILAEQRVATAEQRLIEAAALLDSKEQAQHDLIRLLSTRAAFAIRQLIFFMGFAAVVLSVHEGSIGLFPKLPGEWRILGSVFLPLFTATTVLQVANVVWGTTLVSTARWAELRLGRLIDRVLTGIFMPA